jgi:hypothetical protein
VRQLPAGGRHVRAVGGVHRRDRRRRAAGDERRHDRDVRHATFASGTATFANINFNPGQNDVTATETDPAGNRTTFATVPCRVTVGSAPVVQFTTPTANQILCPNGSTATCVKDVDATTADWQGAITVHVTGDGQPLANGGTVTFTYTVGAGTPVTLGSGPVTIDGSGNASLPVATLRKARSR